MSGRVAILMLAVGLFAGLWRGDQVEQDRLLALRQAKKPRVLATTQRHPMAFLRVIDNSDVA